MRSRRAGYTVLSTCLATLGALLLLGPLAARRQSGFVHAQAHGAGNPWPLTADGRSRFAAWSPDGRTVLVNRWGAVVGDGTTRQALSELWAVDVRGGPATRLSGDAVQPAYSADGRRLAYLAFAGDGRWEVHVLDLASGQEDAWATASWRMPPAWVDGRLAFAHARRVWLSSDGARAVLADVPTLPPGARVRLSAAGGRHAWSDGAHLWVQPHPGAEPRLLVADTQVLGFTWSPDGGRLAYVVVAEDLSPALWVADVAGDGAPELLAQGQAEVFAAPIWSPDGRMLAFYHVTTPASEDRLVEIFPDGSLGEHVKVPLKVPLHTFFTAGVRGGCQPSWYIDVFGDTRKGGPVGGTMRYARIRLAK